MKKKEIENLLFTVFNKHNILLKSKDDYEVLVHQCELHNDLYWLYLYLDDDYLCEYHSEMYHTIYRMILINENFTQKQKNDFINYIN
jgi:hypothetical protein